MIVKFQGMQESSEACVFRIVKILYQTGRIAFAFLIGKSKRGHFSCVYCKRRFLPRLAL